MNNNVHVISDDQLEYLLCTIEDLDYELARRPCRIAFNCPDYIAAYETLRHLRNLIADFSINCTAAAIGPESDNDNV